MSVNYKMLSRFILTLASSSFFLMKEKNVIYFIIALIGMYYLFDLTFYLPFLDEAYIPFSINTQKINNFVDASVQLDNLPPNTQIYWAAKKESNIFTNPLDAYLETPNTGVATTNNAGSVIIKIQCPGTYLVNKNMELPKHIHYRYALSKFPGMYSKVFTKNVICG